MLSIPRRIIDARRPYGKPTKVEQEEMLIPYEPLIAVEPRWTLSHTLEIVGVAALASTSTLLESSSIVIAYGQDLFSAIALPSGQFDVLSSDFNKPQLILTLIALAAGIAITRPIVRQKALRARWYDAQ